MGFYPVEVLVNDTKRHGVAVLPVDVNGSSYKTTTEWVGRPGEPLPPGGGIDGAAGAGGLVGLRRAVGGGARAMDAGGDRGLGRAARAAPREGHRGAARGAAGRRAGARPVPLARGRRRADRPARGGPGAAHPERGDGFAGAAAARAAVAASRGGRGVTRPDGRPDGPGAGSRGRQAGRGGRPADGPAAPATDAPALPAITESERIGDAYAVLGVDARRQVVGLFRPALDRLGRSRTRPSPTAVRAGSGSVGWSSPASTR